MTGVLFRAVSDVHAGFGALARVAAEPGPLVVLGDFLNFIDYRTGAGMVSDILGPEFATRAAWARGSGTDARTLWAEAVAAHPGDFRAELLAAAESQYADARAALEGAGPVWATFGNVDHPGLLRERLAGVVTVLHGDAVDVDGLRVGLVGGGRRSPFGGDGEVDLDTALARLGPVDVLGSHLPPAVPALYRDVVTGLSEKHAEALSDYIAEHRPRLHLFGDVHQPRATTWRLGATTCVNVGYFRATGRAVTIMADGTVC